MKNKITFEIEDVEYELPDFISIDNYVKVFKVKDLFSDQYLSAKLLNILTGAPLDKLLNTNFQAIQQLSEFAMLMFPQGEVKFKDKFILNGVWYGFIPSWKKLSFKEWVDLDTLMSKKPDEILDYIHILTAIMYRPIVGDHKNNNFKIEDYDVDKMVQRSELFLKELDVKYFIGAQFFFIKFAKKYLERTQQSLSLMKTIKFIWRNRRWVVPLLLKKDLDGTSFSTDLAKTILQNTKLSLKKT